MTFGLQGPPLRTQMRLEIGQWSVDDSIGRYAVHSPSTMTSRIPSPTQAPSLTSKAISTLTERL